MAEPACVAPLPASADEDAVVRRLQTLIRVFDDCFLDSHRTRLIGGGEEPLYRPAATAGAVHCIIFAHDHFASALHEVAHWCIAGPQRRLLTDYGYWYSPDGRDAARQRAFEQVEVRPQALEWIFSRAAGQFFRVSIDNLHGDSGDTSSFKDAVWQQVEAYCQAGLPGRAARFHKALARAFAGPERLETADFPRAALDRFAPGERS